MIKIKHIVSTLFLSAGLLPVGTMPVYAQGDGASNAAEGQRKTTNYKHLTGKELRTVFEDTKMIGEYRQYRDETRTFQYTELHKADGTTDYVEGRKKEDGRWKIIGGDKICYRYPKSQYYTRTYCFFVYNVEGCYYKFSPDNMTYKKGPKSWDRWSSRSIRKGAGGICGVPTS